MAHYAFLDKNNIVVNVIVGKDEGPTDWEKYYAQKTGLVCKRTSYNTRGGVNLVTGNPFRKNFAAKGYTYDEFRDAFIPPQPFPSWWLNELTCLWEPPEPRPEDGKPYVWNEWMQIWENLPVS